MFFAYIGFDVVATTAEEAKNPQRDLPDRHPRLARICTVLYMAVALVVTGMVKYTDIDPGRAAGRRLRVGRQARLRHADLRRVPSPA